jgi:hypothetical protein
VSWEPGRERVRELIEAGEVDRVTADLAIARRMLEDAGRQGGMDGRYRILGGPVPEGELCRPEPDALDLAAGDQHPLLPPSKR